MKHYRVTFSLDVYVEAKNEDQARDKAEEEVSWMSLGDAEISNVELQ